jgi:protein gp37
MAETKIEWAYYTFNGWRGCTRVSAGCHFCYAETLSKRNPGVLGIWGPPPKGKRVVGTDAYWDEPLAWDRAAAAAGERRRVFAYSLADVFEEFSGHLVDVKGERLYNHVDINASAIDGSVGATLDHARARLFRLICKTPNLDWMLLTKRPENILPMLRRLLRMFVEADLEPESSIMQRWLAPGPGGISKPPRNLWFGTSVEDQEAASIRIPLLRAVPAVCRFLSVEPLLSSTRLNLAIHAAIPKHVETWPTERVNNWWVIAGGESGPNARPMHPDNARSIRDECLESNVPFLFKQWGDWAPEGLETAGRQVVSRAVFPDGSHLPDLTGRGTNGEGAAVMWKVGKKAAGRLLDRREWNEVPDPLKNRRVQTVP